MTDKTNTNYHIYLHKFTYFKLSLSVITSGINSKDKTGSNDFSKDEQGSISMTSDHLSTCAFFTYIRKQAPSMALGDTRGARNLRSLYCIPFLNQD